MHNSWAKRLQNGMDREQNYTESTSSVRDNCAQNICTHSQHLSGISESRTLPITSSPLIIDTIDLTEDDEETTSSEQVTTPPMKRTKYLTNDQNVDPCNIEVHSQAHPVWYRMVSYVNDEPMLSRPVSSSWSFDSTHQQVRPQVTLDSHPNCYCQATPSNAGSNSSQQSQQSRSMAHSQITSYSEISKQAHSSRSHPVNNIPQSVSRPINQLKFNGSTLESDEIDSRSQDSSPEFTYTSAYPNPPHSEIKSTETGLSSLSNSSHSRLNETRNITNVQSSESSNVNNSSHAQVIIDIDDFPIFEEIQSQVPITHSINLTISSTRLRNLPSNSIDCETIDVVFRSRNNETYTVTVTNPDVIRMHKTLQRHFSGSGRSRSTDLFLLVSNYIRLLSSIVATNEANNLANFSSFLGSLVPQSLTIDDQSSYSLLNTNDTTSSNIMNDSDEMPPVNTIDRIQNGEN